MHAELILQAWPWNVVWRHLPVRAFERCQGCQKAIPRTEWYWLYRRGPHLKVYCEGCFRKKGVAKLVPIY